jgi:thiol peroxidase
MNNFKFILKNRNMATITFKGSAVKTEGNLPTKGSVAPDFKLVKNDLSEVSLKDFAGKKVVLNIFPSIDTGVCAASVRKFNAEASSLSNTVVLCVSRDLPFAHSRFCGAEGLNNVVSASEFRTDQFSKAYGVKMADGPLAGLLSRAVVVVDETGKVVYTEQVPEIAQEPDYSAALKALA